ncbi:MAG: UDP-2,3-diacylglucosamine diphosphatase [Gammaproteobacteria bacterium]|nr:UDP-2,3-diacylglucosamine diphosphatase [Gammaproteobacteria bacterium]
MSTLFISDLHLSLEQPASSGLFLQFLADQAPRAEALYILGDLFEVWLGDDLIPPEVQPILDALRTLREYGVPVYVMHGNRDFLLGGRFAALSGVTLLEDPTVIDLYGTPTLLMHGDLLCSDDTPYQEMRTMLRRPEWITAFLAKSTAERIAFARSLRERSKEETGAKAEAIMDISAATLRQYVARHNVRRLIHGHTHRPAIHHESGIERCVLGDWYQQGSVLRCDQHGCQLESLSAGIVPPPPPPRQRQ